MVLQSIVIPHGFVYRVCFLKCGRPIISFGLAGCATFLFMRRSSSRSSAGCPTSPGLRRSFAVVATLTTRETKPKSITSFLPGLARCLSRPVVCRRRGLAEFAPFWVLITVSSPHKGRPFFSRVRDRLICVSGTDRWRQRRSQRSAWPRLRHSSGAAMDSDRIGQIMIEPRRALARAGRPTFGKPGRATRTLWPTRRDDVRGIDEQAIHQGIGRPDRRPRPLRQALPGNVRPGCAVAAHPARGRGTRYCSRSASKKAICCLRPPSKTLSNAIELLQSKPELTYRFVLAEMRPIEEFIASMYAYEGVRCGGRHRSGVSRGSGKQDQIHQAHRLPAPGARDGIPHLTPIV